MTKPALPRPQKAEVVREYGPFPDVEKVGGVTFDGQHAWLAAGTHLQAFEPASGKPVRRIEVAADAGTAFDGRHLYQITGDVIQKVDPKSGQVVGTIPAPGRGGDSGTKARRARARQRADSGSRLANRQGQEAGRHAAHSRALRGHGAPRRVTLAWTRKPMGSRDRPLVGTVLVRTTPVSSRVPCQSAKKKVRFL